MKLLFEIVFCIFVAFALIPTNGFASQAFIFADDGKAGDAFGYSAAIDGTTVLVGAHKADMNGVVDSGAAYIYVLSDSGWRQQAKLFANPYISEDMLGGNVALKNDIAMLGVMRRDDKGEDSGAVFSFERHSDSWLQSQVLTAPDARPGDAFGQSIALTDKLLVIGAPRSDSLGTDSGAVYVYKREDGRWCFQAKITASDGAEGDLFGISVAIDEKTVLVGADLHDEKADDAGAVYVFTEGNSQWIQEAKLMANDGEKSDIFGVRVAISEDTALISARRDDIEGTGEDAGSAYIFVRSGGVWRQEVKLTSPDGMADDRFGRGVALSGTTAVISAMNHDANGRDTGAVYVYKRHEGSWQFSSKVLAKNSEPDDRFGWNLSMSDDAAVIVSPNNDINGQESGAIYIQDLGRLKN